MFFAGRNSDHESARSRPWLFTAVLCTLICLAIHAPRLTAAEPTLSELILTWKNDDAVAYAKAHPEQLNARDKDGFPPLVLVASQGNNKLLGALLELNPNINLTDHEGITALMRAAKNGSTDCVKTLLAKGADPSLREPTGKNAEDYARERNHPELADLLKSATANPGGAPAKLITPPAKLITHPESGENFLQAIGAFHSAIAKGLIEQDPTQVNAVNEKHQTGLHLAGLLCNAPIIQVLLEHGADPTLRDDDGETTLHAAVRGNGTEAVKLLLLAGVDPNIKNKAGQTPLELAKSISRFAVVPLLTDALAGKLPPSATAGNQLLEAIARGDLPGVKAIVIPSPALAIQADAAGRTPLHFAMMSKSDIAAFLLTQKADVNKGDLENWRPIHIAAESGRADMVKLLLENAADPNPVATQSSQTPLYIATVYGFTEVAKNLLAGHANPNLNNSRGVSPLHRAAESGYLDMVSLLIVAKAEINAKDQSGRTPLDYAIAANRLEVIGLLQKYGATGSLPVPTGVAAGAPAGGPAIEGNPTPGAGPAPVGVPGLGQADPNATLDPAQVTAWLDACTKNDDAKINALLKENPSLIYAKNGSGYNALHLLAHDCNIETVKKILDLGLPVDIPHRWGRTPLNRAAEFGNYEMAKLLLDRGANINAVDNERWTALHQSAKNAEDPKGMKTLQLLLDRKADTTLKDSSGLTPYGEAKKIGNAQTVAVLEARGIKE
ncbi:MAG TPA: ankyrin repeat domain-containing protein [Planctomycetota bacterium]|nr:ankyrin repeat domain-containing protein [Planctomycetota bacterium]